MVCCLRGLADHAWAVMLGAGLLAACLALRARPVFWALEKETWTAALVTLRSDKIPPGEVYRLLCVVNADAGPATMEKGRRSSGGVVSPISSSRSQTKRLSPSREQPILLPG